MAQKGLLKVICGTDTLGVGVNVPIRSVLLTQLCKYDGEKTRILTARDFHQICGRAGRKGFDDQGWVICQAPEHVIENLKMDRKAAKDPAKKKKMVKRKPPEKGFVNWSEETFRKLIEAGPEPLVSSFEVTHGMLLNVLSRSTDGCEAMRQIIRNSHETDHAKRLHRKRAWELFRSLVQRNIIEVLPERLRDGAKVRVNLDLQEDFSLNQTLSLFLLDSIPLLDPEAEDYVPRTITLVESILENPQVILRKQLDKVRGEAVAEMKRQGVSYDDRMEELEKLEYPKPDRDFIYQTFNDFAATHPWVGTENIQPKSIAREMYEKFSSFNDYVKSYGLQKSEGILLRHISNVFKVLNQTVPDQWKTEELDDATIYFESMIRGVDSSLIDEWEKLHDQEAQAELARIREARSADESTRTGAAKERPDDITRHPARLEKEARILVFEIVRALAIRDIEFALEKIADIAPDGATDWTAENLESRLDHYLESHQLIRTDPEARNIRNTHLEKFPEDDKWIISQTLVDPDASNDWAVTFELSLSRTRTANWPRMKFISFESLI
jgi:superfamily II RNA helicase